jgi:hypothetical protein
MTTKDEKLGMIGAMLFNYCVSRGIDPKSQALREVINEIVNRVDLITTKETK